MWRVTFTQEIFVTYYYVVYFLMICNFRYILLVTDTCNALYYFVTTKVILLRNALPPTLLTCCRKPPSFPTSYSILSQLLQHVTEHPYLGVVIDSKMSFSSHIDHITLKATRMLNFIKRNLYKCS